MLVSRPLLDDILGHAELASPEECCGLVAVKDGVARQVYRARNVADNPRMSFEVHPFDQAVAMADMESWGWTAGAVYHSHPRWIAYPSKTDLQLAFYPDMLMLIVGMEVQPEARAFWIKDGRPVDAPLTVVD